jgi:dolichol kinase
MVFTIITLPITILFIVMGLCHLYYAIELKRRFPKEHNFYDSFIVFLLWIVSGIIYPFFYMEDNEHIRFHQSLSMTIICFFSLLLIFSILMYQHRVVLKDRPYLKENRTLAKFLEKYELTNVKQNNKSYSLKTDFHRKLFHLLPAGVIIILWNFSVHIWEGVWHADQVWGITGQDYGMFFILTIGYAGVMLFAALDFIRLSYIFENRNIYHLLPDSLSNLLIKALRRDEIYEFTKTVMLVLSIMPILFLPFGVFAATALITSIGDGAASLVGVAFGKHHFPKNNNKTIIGYVAGFLASFGVSIFALFLFEPALMPFKVIVMSLSGGIVFLIIDLLSLKIDDNILNPIFCGIIMTFFYFIL